MTRRPLLRAAIPGALVLLIGGCSWFGGGDSNGPKLACPGAVIAPGLDAFTQFRPGGGTTTADIQFGVKLLAVKATCQQEASGIAVDARITFLAARNDDALRQGDFTYFVAVTDSQQNILAKQTFTLRAEFARRQNEMRIADNIVEHLPLRNVSEGGSYAVIIGMQLSQQQLDLLRQRTVK